MKKVFVKNSINKSRWIIVVVSAVIVAAIMSSGWGTNSVLADSPPPESPEATCPAGGQCFTDVTSGNVFYPFVNRIYQQDLVTGYACGGPGEQCDPESRPYYRPLANVTRQQMAKFIDNARHLPGIDIEVTGGVAPIIANNSTGTAIGAYSTSGQAIVAASSTNSAIYAQANEAAVITAYGTGSTAASYGVYGTGNTGVYGGGDIGVKGVGASTGVSGTSPSGVGVYGETGNVNGSGVYGKNLIDNGVGVWGKSNGQYSAGVYGESNIGNGVRGDTSGQFGAGVYGGNIGTGYGVYGVSQGDGVFGVSSGNGAGVVGSADHIGVLGDAITGHGVEGNSNSGVGVYGSSGLPSGWAGYFDGNVNVTGGCCGASEATTRIDHPLDPANKYLNQSLVESPDMISVLSGNVTTDGKGEAIITLPDYFQAANGDFRYQLTVIGEFAQAIISSKIKENHFSIKTDKPSVEVSWQVTGVRQDPYAQQHPITVEQAKPAGEQGKYLHPAEYGQPESLGVNYSTRQAQQAAQTKP